jgi:hypothetical protein
LDRASGYEPEGREFESLRARHEFKYLGAPHRVPLPFVSEKCPNSRRPGASPVTDRAARPGVGMEVEMRASMTRGLVRNFLKACSASMPIVDIRTPDASAMGSTNCPNGPGPTAQTRHGKAYGWTVHAIRPLILYAERKYQHEPQTE